MAKHAFLFPGQGAQVLGMGRQAVEQAPAAAALFDRASDVLGYHLLDVCLNGPEDRLHSTAVSQPALFVAGLAAVEVLRLSEPDVVEHVSATAGLSLGEYTALVFAGAMTFEDALAVVKVRGESMQAAADASPSGMVAVLGLSADAVEQLCLKSESKGFVRPANYLCDGNIVVSGDLAALDELERLAPEAGAMKTIRLTVAGAFHTQLMQPADEKLAAALAQVPIQPPRIPVWSNVDGLAHTDPESIRAKLVRQVIEPVRWEECVRGLLADGCDRFYELGPGRVLAGLLKRISRRTEITNIGV